MAKKKSSKKKKEEEKEQKQTSEQKEKPELEEFIELEELREELKEENEERQAGKEESAESALQEKSKKESKEKESKKTIINAILARERVLTEATDEARALYDKSAYGQILDDGRVQLALPEALYLLEKGKIEIKEGKKKLSVEDFIKKARKVEPNFWIRYCVFKDMRNRGYIIKTALKFGADFRVYDRGIKPGEDHARWIIFPVHEGETLTWYEFAAKNRVAHSTKKRLMMGIVDDEGDVTYYEIKWMRP